MKKKDGRAVSQQTGACIDSVRHRQDERRLSLVVGVCWREEGEWKVR